MREVFKQGLTFKDGAFRTPSINPAFEHNLLILKEKGLLFLEQPSDVLDGLCKWFKGLAAQAADHAARSPCSAFPLGTLWGFPTLVLYGINLASLGFSLLNWGLTSLPSVFPY